MLKSLFSSLKVLKGLIQKELLIISRHYKGRVLDMIIATTTTVLVFSYFMPELQQNGTFGTFILAGTIATFGFFRVVDKTIEIIVDLDGDRRILYDLTFPLPSWMVFSNIAVASVIETFLLSILLFPLGKLLLWNNFDLSTVSWWRLIIIYSAYNLFYGFFGLWLGSRLKHMGDAAHIWVRVVMPLFMFGSFYYPWSASFQLNPYIGYLSLLNPIVYANEGMRSAMIGPEGFLPFWGCVLFLLGITCVVGVHGCISMKKRLDTL